MGVKNLWDILESCKQTLPLHHLQNKRLCVDLSCWLIQFQNTHKSRPCMKEKLYLMSLFHRLRALIALNCNLIFVTDGSIPSIKLSTYRRRLGSGSEVTREETNSQTVQSLRRNMGSEFSCMIKEAKVLGMALGIPCLDGLEEAEAQCAFLNSASLCDGCFTSDSDIFLFGARTVYRDILVGEGGYVTCYKMVDIETKLGFGRNSLITLALLLGSDYSQGVHGFGRGKALRIVKSISDDTVLHRIVSEGLVFARKTKGTKKTSKIINHDVNKENELFYTQSICVNDQNSGSDGQFLEVINAYLNPKCHSPDSEAVQRACAQHPFLRTQLQQICVRYFGWSPDQIDQYILPKIAERDLRRFVNLRTTSSELGLRIPLHNMPIPCPVSTVIKQRKVHGRECFEVSWHKVDGLRTSIVPADLVESACPEKIAEFIERKAEAKKLSRRPKLRKPHKTSVSEVDLQLQDLLLSIESQCNELPSTTKFHQPAALSIDPPCDAALHPTECRHPTGVDFVESEVIDLPAFPSTTKFHQPAALSIDPPSDAALCPTVCRHPTGVDIVESEVIDLSSPSPPLRACKIAKHRKGVGLHVDPISISESETDTSPDHDKKSRELRMFIDSIRGDLF